MQLCPSRPHSCQIFKEGISKSMRKNKWDGKITMRCVTKPIRWDSNFTETIFWIVQVCSTREKFHYQNNDVNMFSFQCSRYRRTRIVHALHQIHPVCAKSFYCTIFVEKLKHPAFGGTKQIQTSCWTLSKNHATDWTLRLYNHQLLKI